jgi:hypothetical protein
VKLPNAPQLEDMIALAVRDLASPGRKSGKLDLSHADRIREAFRRDRTGTARRDGFPAGGDGASTGPGDPTGEAATAKPVRDHHHEDCTKIASDLRAIIDAYDGIVLALNRIDDRSTAADLDVNPEPICEHHSLRGHTVLAWRYGDLNAKLPRPMHLCRSCVVYASRYGELPEVKPDGRLVGKRVTDSRQVGTGGAFEWHDRSA